jgi:hypothetical protein
MINLYIGFGLLFGFLSYSTYFSARVSKGLTIPQLYSLVYSNPIEDDLLHYTFRNLFLLRVCLIIAWIFALGLGGLIYGQIGTI